MCVGFGGGADIGAALSSNGAVVLVLVLAWVSVVVTAVDGRAVPVVPLALQDTQVCSAEGGVAQRVTHGIDGRVNVAEVVEEVPQLGWDARA